MKSGKTKKKEVVPEEKILNSFKSALKRLKGYERRQFAAELCRDYFNSSPRKMERYLSVRRDMVELGLKELETGYRCVENFHLRGRRTKSTKK